MNVTAFGAVFLAATAFVYLFRRAWLLPLLCVAAVLQSPSVLDVQLLGAHYGITPFVLCAAVVAIDLLRVRGSAQGVALTAPARRVVRLWLAFGVVAAFSALLWPWLFAGAPVISPLAKSGTASEPVALAFSISNLAQLVNLGLVMAVLLWLVAQRDAEDLPRRMFVGVALAVLVSALIGLQQRLAWNGLLPLWDGFWTSNPTYAQNFRTWSGPVPRVNWPLVEPSYASAWFAAALGGFIAMFLADVHRHKALAGAMVAVFALGNTWGATGLLTAGVFLALILAVSAWVLVFRPALRGGLFYRLALGVLVFTCVALGTWLVVRHYQLGDLVLQAMGDALKGRRNTVLGDLHPQGDLHSLRLLADTWGLGAGMGSHRGSSYLATLASTVGLPGLVLFVLALGCQLYALVRLLPHEPAASVLFFLGSASAATIAVTIAIPDQNWPVLWILVLGGLSCLLVEREPGRAAAQPTQPAGRLEPHQGAV